MTNMKIYRPKLFESEFLTKMKSRVNYVRHFPNLVEDVPKYIFKKSNTFNIVNACKIYSDCRKNSRTFFNWETRVLVKLISKWCRLGNTLHIKYTFY